MENRSGKIILYLSFRLDYLSDHILNYMVQSLCTSSYIIHIKTVRLEIYLIQIKSISYARF